MHCSSLLLKMTISRGTFMGEGVLFQRESAKSISIYCGAYSGGGGFFKGGRCFNKLSWLLILNFFPSFIFKKFHRLNVLGRGKVDRRGVVPCLPLVAKGHSQQLNLSAHWWTYHVINNNCDYIHCYLRAVHSWVLRNQSSLFQDHTVTEVKTEEGKTEMHAINV